MHVDDIPLLQAILRYFPAGISLTDRDMRIVYVNQKTADLLEFPFDFIASGTCLLEDVVRYLAVQGHYGPGDIDTLVAHRMAIVGSREVQIFELPLKSGRILEIQNVPIEDGGFLRTYVDITDRRRREVSVARLAHYDSLTDLPNRATFEERLKTVLAGKTSNRTPVVLYLDLDRFKVINDTLGHPIGDALLQAVAKRLSSCVRSTDMVARLGGDEFAVVLVAAQPEREAELLAKRILKAISEPYEIDGHRIFTGVSIGIAVACGDETCEKDLVKRADLALYQSKNADRGVYRFFPAGV